MKMPSSEAWRYANRKVRTFFNLNPALLVFFLFTIFCFHVWSVVLCFLLVVFFAFIEYKGIPTLMAFRWLQTQLTKQRKRIRPRWIR